MHSSFMLRFIVFRADSGLVMIVFPRPEALPWTVRTTPPRGRCDKQAGHAHIPRRSTHTRWGTRGNQARAARAPAGGATRNCGADRGWLVCARERDRSAARRLGGAFRKTVKSTGPKMHTRHTARRHAGAGRPPTRPTAPARERQPPAACAGPRHNTHTYMHQHAHATHCTLARVTVSKTCCHVARSANALQRSRHTVCWTTTRAQGGASHAQVQVLLHNVASRSLRHLGSTNASVYTGAAQCRARHAQSGRHLDGRSHAHSCLAIRDPSVLVGAPKVELHRLARRTRRRERRRRGPATRGNLGAVRARGRASLSQRRRADPARGRAQLTR